MIEDNSPVLYVTVYFNGHLHSHVDTREEFVKSIWPDYYVISVEADHFSPLTVIAKYPKDWEPGTAIYMVKYILRPYYDGTRERYRGACMAQGGSFTG